MSTFATYHLERKPKSGMLGNPNKRIAAGGRPRSRRSVLFATLATLGLATGIAGLTFVNSGADPLTSFSGITTNILPSVSWDDSTGQTPGWMPYAGDNGPNMPVTPETGNTVSAGDSRSVPPPAHPAG